jgi:NADPH:quinone reductase-like Zn-dependent oxidoreductase
VDSFARREDDIVVPTIQSALLLHSIRQPYKITDDHQIPTIQNDFELLVKVKTVGLNPIDWKAP